MNKKWLVPVMLLGLSACKTYQNELLFAESTEVGLTLAPNPAGGGQLVFGYRQTDLAVVPVGAITADGRVLQRRATAGVATDAVSVFAQFNADLIRSSGETALMKPTLALGRFFATGIAATRLAKGYQKGMSDSSGDEADGNADPAGTSNSANWRGGARADSFIRTAVVDGPGPSNNAVDSQPPVREAEKMGGSDTKHSRALRPLIFGQRDSFGLTVGTALESATQFSASIGYSGRNVAVMPVFADKGDGSVVKLSGGDGTDDSEAFSVIGQFRADANTDTAEVALERFFATGLAAQHLSSGFASRIEREIVEAEQRRRAAEAAGSTKAN